MLTTILEVVGLLAIIVVPLRSPKKKKAITRLKIDKDTSHANYAIDKEGNLVAIHGNELTGHTH